MRFIRLTAELQLGAKIVPPGIIVQLDRASMNQLVKEQKAFYCTEQGRRLKVNFEEEE